MIELYFVSLYSLQTKNKLQEKLEELAREYDRTLITQEELKDIAGRYRQIIDSYQGTAKKPAFSLRKFGTTFSICFYEGCTLNLTKVKHRPLYSVIRLD